MSKYKIFCETCKSDSLVLGQPIYCRECEKLNLPKLSKGNPATWKDYALGFGLIMFVLGFSAGFMAATKFLQG